MRQYVGILICLWVAARALAVTYQPCTPSSFRSTSVYVGGAADYNQSSYTIHSTPYTTKATGSLSAISASNFAALNDEGGACYIPSATKGRPRKVKIDEPGTEAVGEGVWESPVGEIPFFAMILLVTIYFIFVKRRKVRAEA